MEQAGIHWYFGSGRAAAEKVHRTSFTYEVECEFPNFRPAYGFDDDIGATSGGVLANLSGRFLGVVQEHTLVGAEGDGAVDLFDAPCDGDDPRPEGGFGETDEHQADRTKANHSNSVSRPNAALIEATQSAGKRFHQSRIAIIEICRDEVRILVHDTGRHTNEFGVSAIVEKQISQRFCWPRRQKKQ